MTPDFLLLADGIDVTLTLRDRLVALDVTDEDGLEADRLSIELDDRDRRIAVPGVEARLDLWLGFRETGLTAIGRYVVERRAGGGPPDTMRLEAKAADMGSGIRAPKTRAWRDVTLGDMVAKIASEAELRPAIGADIAGTAYTMVAQTAESDLHLLTRLARVLDAAAKPAGGRLVVARRGTGKAADGSAIPVRPLRRADFSRYGWDLGERGRYGSVTAEWSDPASASLNRITVGDGEPEKRLRHPFGSEDEARRAARADLDRAERGVKTVDGQLGGFHPELFAGGLVAFPDLRPELAGRYLLTGVTHTFRGALTTSIRSEIAHA